MGDKWEFPGGKQEDGESMPEALARGLTTVAQPSLEKGRRAGYLLNNPPRSGIPVIEVLDTELVRGRTSGPPA